MTRLIIVLTLCLGLTKMAHADGPSIVFLSNWPALSGAGLFDGPFDVVCAPDGTVLVSHLFGPNLERFTHEGGPLGELPVPPLPGGSTASPSMMAIDNSGNIYVCVGLGYVQKLTPGGGLI